jgi:hypothetical protein
MYKETVFIGRLNIKYFYVMRLYSYCSIVFCSNNKYLQVRFNVGF